MANAPPDIKAKSMSGKLFAALNTSNSLDNPNCRPMISWRIMPNPLSRVKNKAIINEMRVIRLTFLTVQLQQSILPDYATSIHACTGEPPQLDNGYNCLSGSVKLSYE
jgi:hypothetical protein